MPYLTIVALYHYIRSRKNLKSKISYYSNSSSTFNFLELSILLSGDVHPLPGLENRKSISVRISQRTRRRHGNLHTEKVNHKRSEVRTIINIPTISEQSPNVKNISDSAAWMLDQLKANLQILFAMQHPPVRTFTHQRKHGWRNGTWQRELN